MKLTKAGLEVMKIQRLFSIQVAVVHKRMKWSRLNSTAYTRRPEAGRGTSMFSFAKFKNLILE